MNNDIAISVKSLSKEYILGNGEDGSASYVTLRETIYDNFSRLRQEASRLIYGRRIENTKRGPDKFLALDDVSFDVKRGQKLGLIGRNGAGKSTLLKLLSRITYPTRGEINIFGKVASLLEVGTGFHPELTGRENVYLNGAILGMPKKEIAEKFEQIIDFSGINKFIDTPVKRYSSGMYVRLAFSVAAHLETEILIVDEVLAVGDIEFQKKCLEKMEDLGRDGRTVIFVSHQLESIEKLCDSAIVMEAGRVAIYDDVITASEYYKSLVQ